MQLSPRRAGNGYAHEVARRRAGCTTTNVIAPSVVWLTLFFPDA
jgi:hypothetical protein